MKKNIVLLFLFLSVISVACVPVFAGDLNVGHIYTASEVKSWAIAYGEQDIVDALNQKTPTLRFVSDGCSGPSPQKWHGKSLLPACIPHDVRYWIGGSQVDKLKADAKLMIDVADITGDPAWAVVMFNSVHAGGNMPGVSWQWGKVGIE